MKRTKPMPAVTAIFAVVLLVGAGHAMAAKPAAGEARTAIATNSKGRTPAIKWGEPIAIDPVPTPTPAPQEADKGTGPARAEVLNDSTPMPASAALQPAPSSVAAASGPPIATTETEAVLAAPVWRLTRGIALHTQLQAWAAASGWQLEWKLTRSWIVPADVVLGGSFDQAVEQVVQALAREGKPVNLIIWEGNHVAEVNETAPR